MFTHKYFIYKKEGVFYINHQKIIDKKSALQFAIFEILIEHYFYEVINGECYISLKSMCDMLEEKSIYLDNPQNQISNTIYKIRINIKKTTKIKQQIIDNKKWEGYRINNAVFLSRSDDFFL